MDYNAPLSLVALGAGEGVSLGELVEQYGLRTRKDYFAECRRLGREARERAGRGEA